MPAFRDLTGQKFGRWTVLNHAGKKYAEQFWLCQCDCGTKRILIGGTLKKGSSKSCGCYSKEQSTKHGMEQTKTYTTWAQMKARCRNKNHKEYPRYGGRGIQVCERWDDFRNFYADMGDKPDGMSIDRINNDGNYEPSNCRWVAQTEQIRNRRVSPKFIWDGENKSLAEIAALHNLPWRRVYERIRAGWELSKALQPVAPRQKRLKPSPA